MNKAVVTGAAGFIGTALVHRLVADRWSVVAIDCRPTTHDGVTNVVADVSEPGAVRDWIDSQTTIFHLAAIASVPQSVIDPRADFTNTMRPVFEVLESARAVGARVVFPSTASVFDSSNPLPLDERAMIRPTSPYGAAKVAGEAYCFSYHRAYGVDARIARFFSVFGPGLRRLAIHDLIRKAECASDELEVLGDGTQVRDYLYIDDAVDALLTVACHGRPGEDYNIGSGVPVTALALARLIATAMGRPELRLRTTGASFSGDTPRWYADITKIRNLGFEPRMPFDEGLRRTVSWLTSQRG